MTWIQVSQDASKVVWYSDCFNNLPQFAVIHTVKGFSIVSQVEDVFLKFPCFFYDAMNVGNLISGSFEFSKTSFFSVISWFTYCWSFSSVQSLSHVQLFATPWTAAHQASLSITNSRNLLKFRSIESMMPSSHLILCHPLLLMPSVFPSIRVFSNESALHIRWPKYWSFSFNINPSSEHSGLISFRMDWLHLLTIQGTLKSLLQHHSWKTSIYRHSAFFIVQLTSIHDYWKNHSFD